MIALIAALITAVQIGAPSPLYEPGADCPTGYEKGVSAMFAGAVGDTLIMAGGANFPDVPVSEGDGNDSITRYLPETTTTPHGHITECCLNPQPMA